MKAIDINVGEKNWYRDERHTDRDCKCLPTFEKQPNGDTLVIHNAFDFREFDEAAKQINEWANH